MKLPTDQSQFSADIPNAAGFGGFGDDFPQVSYSHPCLCSLLPFCSYFITTNSKQIPFDETDVPLDEFFFGNPAAWTFENLWSNN